MNQYSIVTSSYFHWIVSGLLVFIYICFFFLFYRKKSDKSSLIDQHEKGIFPVFTDPDVIHAYRDYKITFKSLGPLSLPRSIVNIVFLQSLRKLSCGWSNSPLGINYSMVLVAIISFVIIYVSAAVTAAVIARLDPNSANERLQYWKKLLRSTLLNGILEEIIAVSAVVWCGLILYGRVGASALDAEGPTSCVAALTSLNALPTGHIFFMAFLAISIPLSLRGIRFEVAILLLLICVVSVIAALNKIGRSVDFLSIALYIIPLTMIFEHERFMRLSFLNLKITEQRSEALIEVSTRSISRIFIGGFFTQCAHFCPLSSQLTTKLERRNQKELAALERAQLVAIIGNVAHDLKTPLHSFKMDLDFLRSELLTILANISAKHDLEAEGKSLSNPSSAHGSSRPTASPGAGPGPSSQLLPASIESLMRSLSGSAEFMTMAINRGIEFTKASGGIQLQPTMSSFHLGDALMMPLQILHSLKSNTVIELLPLQPSIAPYIITDQHWLRENTLCLLSNALKYSKDGTTVTFAIDLIEGTDLMPEIEEQRAEQQQQRQRHHVQEQQSADSSGSTTPNDGSVTPTQAAEELPVPTQQYLRFTVLDRGIGIPEEVRKKLFRPFQQAQRLAGGTGLGLYSLSMRMRALGGYRGVKSRPDGQDGSAFWFALPYKPDTMMDAQPTDSERSSGTSTPLVVSLSEPPKDNPDSATSSMKNKPRVLIVDDSLSVLKVTERSVKQAGLECETATNGAIALERMKEALSNSEIDVVMIDFQMPVMDGPTCVSRYREYETEYIRQSQKYRDEVGDEDDDVNIKVDETSPPRLSSTDSTVPSYSDSEKSSSSSSSSRRRRSERVAIVGMSANSDEANRSLGLGAGMDAFIPKPFNLNELKSVLAELIYK
jgi:signal transduction histidine kinase/CheY-like chemotaxis protein